MKKLECTECKNIQTIRRLASKNKKVGHIKDLWCIMCKKVTPHKELSDYG